MTNNPMANYDMNNSPIVSTPKESTPFNKTSFQQGDMNLAPLTSVVASKPAFNMPKNSVTSSSSNRLQNASKLPGRTSDGVAHSKLCC